MTVHVCRDRRRRALALANACQNKNGVAGQPTMGPAAWCCSITVMNVDSFAMLQYKWVMKHDTQNDHCQNLHRLQQRIQGCPDCHENAEPHTHRTCVLSTTDAAKSAADALTGTNVPWTAAARVVCYRSRAHSLHQPAYRRFIRAHGSTVATRRSVFIHYAPSARRSTATSALWPCRAWA